MIANIPTRIQPTDTPEQFNAAVLEAARRLRRGELVAVPTETVYGLAANALDAEAVSRIYEAKDRPAHNPIIVHVAGLEMARQCAADWPRLAEDLAAAFWPGPLTLVLSRAPIIPELVTAGGPTVGVRWPNHPFMQALIQACGVPLAAPSANLSGRVSPTTAAHVAKEFLGRIPLIIDAGPCPVGIESTVIDLTVSPPRLLRPGMIHVESLLAVTKGLLLGFGDSEEILRSPGRLPRHYSPRARLVILSWQDENDLRAQLARLPAAVGRVHVIAHHRIPAGLAGVRVSLIPHDPEAFARALYAELHRCDEEGAVWIVVETVPDAPEWHAIADRLRRAAAP